MDILLKPKFWTYIQIKHNYDLEVYVIKSQRSLAAQLRTEIRPLALEVGRCRNIQVDNRLSESHDLGENEDETHFVLYCPYYDKLLMSIVNKAFAQNPEMFWCTDDDRMERLFNFNACKLTSFVSQAWKKCQQGLFNIVWFFMSLLFFSFSFFKLM